LPLLSNLCCVLPPTLPSFAMYARVENRLSPRYEKPGMRDRFASPAPFNFNAFPNDFADSCSGAPDSGRAVKKEQKQEGQQRED
jgi:hypothetical protein